MRKLKAIALIPARYASTRFPYKLVQPLGKKTVIQHTYDNIVATRLFDEVIVVTDDTGIQKIIKDQGGKALISTRRHESGSDRIAEAAQNLDADVIVNVQGDEPFVNAKALQSLLHAFEDDNTVQVGSLMKKIKNKDLLSDPNYVKVVVDKKMDAMYFSRSAIPHLRDANDQTTWYEHIGVYAFRKEILLRFTTWPPSLLEQAEKLEQLRYLENAVRIRMVITESSSVKIDVPADLDRAVEYLKSIS